MNINDAASVSKFLDPDESLVWTGRPSVWRFLGTKQSLLGFLWSLVLPVIFIVVFVPVINDDTGFVDTLMESPGIIFSNPIFLILGFIALSFVYSFAKRILSPVGTIIRAMSTLYAVTDKRAMIITKWPKSDFQSFGKTDINAVKRVEHSSSMGTVYFSEEKIRTRKSTKTVDLGFIGIRDSIYVNALLRHHFFGEGEKPVPSSAPATPGIMDVLASSFAGGKSPDTVLSAELHPNEKILWRGTPSPMRYAFNSRNMAIAIFGAIIFLFSGCMELTKDSPNVTVEGSPVIILVIGFVMMCALVPKFFEGRAIQYVLTNERAIIANTFFGTEMKSIGPEEFHKLRLKQHNDGAVTVYFEEEQDDDDGAIVIGRLYSGFVGLRDAASLKTALEQHFGVTLADNDKAMASSDP